MDHGFYPPSRVTLYRTAAEADPQTRNLMLQFFGRDFLAVWQQGIAWHPGNQPLTLDGDQSLVFFLGWGDSPDDQYNRELFEEQIQIIKKAWYNETFCHRGKHYTLPADDLDDRGREVTSLTLIPKPWRTPVEIWQPVTSPRTYEYVAREGHNAVYWVMSLPRLRQGSPSPTA